MLRLHDSPDFYCYNSKSMGNHVVSPEEEKERLQWEGFAEKEGF